MKVDDKSKPKENRKNIAESTLKAIHDGSYTLNGTTHVLSTAIELSTKATSFYAPDSFLSMWSNRDTDSFPVRERITEVSVLEISTLDGVRLLAATIPKSTPHNRGDDTHIEIPSEQKIAILNFASAKNPGGGFMSGAQAQEESIARSSTLYPTLITPTAKQFYTMHKNDPKGGYYSHAMIYSPRGLVFRKDDGEWIDPIEVEILTSAAVNAGVVRNSLHGKVAGSAEEVKIGKVMKERMARILYLFERRGVKNIVLGSFGTGVFKNNVSMVAAIWAELLLSLEARFKYSFDRVVFAVLGEKTFAEFKDTIEDRKI
jgi:uncharacterized protein (TIGR02452 family)